MAGSAALDSQGHFQFQQLLGSFPQFEASLLMGLVSELRSLNLLRVQEARLERPSMGKFYWN
jgi:hypothetical protein